MKKIIVASTSTVHGSGYLAYILPELATFFKEATTILFIPYARPSGISYEEYTAKAREAFAKIDKKVVGLHEFENPVAAVTEAEAIFTGGGNTFELVNQLYKTEVLAKLQEVVSLGTPYLGTSAGSNICGVTMMNTNDMPIVYPPSFDTMGLIPFNINAHYLDPDPTSKHMGETRETRIKEYHVFNETPVLGLREGSWLAVNGNSIELKGKYTARLFRKGKEAIELSSGTIIDSTILSV
ncbi:dipeptidase PepE [Tenacibaculum amylolyticum]|uniref:dipeptidase PepE n=1 Tax=Tenacibaculum amylolyticum TaxID=104269 RepID=UPI0038955659